MNLRWIENVVALVTPEDTTSKLKDEFYNPAGTSSKNKSILCTIKILLWASFAIIAGITVGQLH